MSCAMMRWSVTVVTLAVLATGGCFGGGPARLSAPSIAAAAAGKAALEQYDANKDGKLSGNELDKVPALKSALKRIDKNNDNAISADEITARIGEWKEANVGRLAVSCTVTRHKRPLAGATVTFVPEKFLGESLKPASGETGKSGTVSPTVETSDPADPPGVAPGFYRVEITKSGDKIPEKYNKQTVLGVEIAPDSPELAGNLKFDLNY